MNGKQRTGGVGWTGLLLAAALIGLAGQSDSAQAQSRVVRGTTHTSVNRSAQVDRSAHVNQNLNVHRDLDVDVDRDYHPIATAAAVGTVAVATAAVVGSVVHTLPPACGAVQVNNVTYQQCGSAWYQPQYAGTQLTYVVVNPPR
jgi:hypothetical protein